MGQTKSILSRVYSSSTNRIDPSSKTQILRYLKPAISTCRIFGVFPYVVIEDEDLKKLSLKPSRRLWLVYSTFILIITTTYMGFQLGSVMYCIGKGQKIVELIAQAMWFSAGLVPYCLSVYMIIAANKMAGIFHAWSKIEMELESLFCHLKTNIYIINFQTIYFKLAILSISACGYHALMEPNNPAYPFYYFPDNYANKNNVLLNGSEIEIGTYHVVYIILQMLIIAWKWAGMAVLEGLCCLFATVFIQSYNSVMDGLEFVISQLKGPQDEDTIEALIKSFTVEGINKALKEKPGKSKSVILNMKGKGKLVASKMTPEEYVMFAIRNLQTFASLQSHINSVVGPLLLLDFGQLVIMTCALSFLPIISVKALDYSAMVIFFGNWITVLARLVILVTCLGNVYTKGQEVNVGLAKGMNSCNLSPLAQSSVLAHLTVFSSNPVCFTAWGFFPITRGTLLAAFSLISTYAVIFLQLNT